MADPTTLEEIMALVDKELEINPTQLDTEANRQVKIFSTLQRLYINATRKLETLATQVDKVKNHRIQYYSGKLTAAEYQKEPLRVSVLKSDIPDMLKIDDKMVEIKSLFNEQERIVKYLEEAKKQLSDRGYSLRLALDFQKFQMGI